jgi:phosphopantothenoylcysteine decarboxylase/phosphopantothenate--cysteine ligase
MIAANEVGAEKGFDTDENELLVLWRTGSRKLARSPKLNLARELIALVAAHFHERRTAAPRARA